MMERVTNDMIQATIGEMSLGELRALHSAINSRVAILREKALIEIRETMSAFGITEKMLEQAMSERAPKYRNPETGATWSGRGPAPLWLRGMTPGERARFLIDGAST
jgi:DNA-binding protein H-NS